LTLFFLFDLATTHNAILTQGAFNPDYAELMDPAMVVGCQPISEEFFSEDQGFLD
jgi:hypothetical protein